MEKNFLLRPTFIPRKIQLISKQAGMQFAAPTHPETPPRFRTGPLVVAKKKGKWTPLEDSTIMRHVGTIRQRGEKVFWRDLEKMLPGRVGKQIRERFYNKLDPHLNRALHPGGGCDHRGTAGSSGK